MISIEDIPVSLSPTPWFTGDFPGAFLGAASFEDACFQVAFVADAFVVAVFFRTDSYQVTCHAACFEADFFKASSREVVF